MVKTCPFCSKELADVDEKFVMHSECFDEYKKIDKTPSTYIMTWGINKGKRYNELDEKYIDYLMGLKVEDKTPVYYFQKQVAWFRKNKSYK